MDEKLARGMARNLIRNLGETGDLIKGPLLEPLLDLQNLYLQGRGLPQDKIIATGMALHRKISGCGPFPTSYRAIRHPVRNRCVIETVRVAAVEGEEQSWAVLAGIVLDIGRTSCVTIETVSHIAVSQHALMRLFQRGSFDREHILRLLDTVSLFALPLLRVALSRDNGIGSEVAVPFADGLLLGTVETQPFSGDQGPTAATVSQEGVYVKNLEAPFQLARDIVAIISINTYVGSWELFDNQNTILSRLEGFASQHRDVMKAIRTCALYGYPDQRMIERFGAGSIGDLDPSAASELSELFTRFYSTPEWTMHAEAHRRPRRFLH